MSESSVREVRTNRLVIESPDGKTVATLEADQGGAGLWLRGPGGLVAICNVKGQMMIGLYKDAEPKGAADLALFLDRGKPSIQFGMGEGEGCVLTLDDLARLVDEGSRRWRDNACCGTGGCESGAMGGFGE